jgi:hypothetical protein
MLDNLLNRTVLPFEKRPIAVTRLKHYATDFALRSALPVQSRNSASNIGCANT